MTERSSERAEIDPSLLLQQSADERVRSGGIAGGILAAPNRRLSSQLNDLAPELGCLPSNTISHLHVYRLCMHASKMRTRGVDSRSGLCRGSIQLIRLESLRRPFSHGRMRGHAKRDVVLEVARENRQVVMRRNGRYRKIIKCDRVPLASCSIR
jgi:hypothetical protein